MDNPLKNLKLEWWHTMLLTTSFFIFTLSLVVPFVAIDNIVVTLFSLGVFFICLGEVANKSSQEALHKSKLDGVVRPIGRDIRVPTRAGKVLWIVGIIFLVWFFIHIIQTIF
ncbi:hypothetical protein CRU96_05780 [Malaciobacter halophilus]|nr:hypothetical protein [Malaciobacter halophilus]RYA23917.1 hypothetical protein CRU96_05780 [Malaciobacter halophilus]